MILPEMARSCLVVTLGLEADPNFISDAGRIHSVFFFGQDWVVIEVETRQVLVVFYFSKYISIFNAFSALIAVQDLFHVLFTTRVVFLGRPVCVELVSDLAVLLFLVGFLDKWVLEELWPGQPFTGCFVEQAL